VRVSTPGHPAHADSLGHFNFVFSIGQTF
jgi:hypothetical protein